MISPFTLRDIPGWWLIVACSCGRSVATPVRMLIERHGPDARPAEIVARMRCRQCGARPAAAEAVERPDASAQGFVGGQGVARRPLT